MEKCLASLFVSRFFIAARAVFIQLQTIGCIAFILGGNVITFFTNRTRHGDSGAIFFRFDSHKFILARVAQSTNRLMVANMKETL
jgi:hypothetical protein